MWAKIACGACHLLHAMHCIWTGVHITFQILRPHSLGKNEQSAVAISFHNEEENMLAIQTKENLDFLCFITIVLWNYAFN